MSSKKDGVQSTEKTSVIEKALTNDNAPTSAKVPTIEKAGESRLVAPMPRSLSIPATVILERRMISRSFWSMPSWYLHAIATGSHLVAADASTRARGTPTGKSEQGDLFAWSGFEVTFYKDACERYWHALIGDKPLVYVICRDVTDENIGEDSSVPSMRPVSVTVDYDEASAAAETDDPVFSRPITGELYRYMEEFVLAHYKPQEFKKRKRRNWSAEGDESKFKAAAKHERRHERERRGEG